jgi:hypothetical protein
LDLGVSLGTLVIHHVVPSPHSQID